MKKLIILLFIALPTMVSAEQKRLKMSNVHDWSKGVSFIVDGTISDKAITCVLYDKNRKTLDVQLVLGTAFSTKHQFMTYGRFSAKDIKYYICVQEQPKDPRTLDRVLKDVDNLLKNM